MGPATDEDPPPAQERPQRPPQLTELTQLTQLTELTGRMDRWEAQLRRYGEVMQQLHEHNETLRRTTLEQVQEPVLRDLIKLVEDYRRLAISWRERADGGPGDMARICTAIVEDLTNLLDRYGVEQVNPSPGEPFDRRLHRGVGSATVHEPHRDGTVHSIRSPGYRLGSRTLRYPQVVVSRQHPRPPVSGQAEQPPVSGQAEQPGQAEQQQPH